MGNMPMIMASAVISTGRKRVESRLERGRDGIFPLGHLLRRKTHDQDAVRGGHAHAHDGAGEGGHAQGGVSHKKKPRDSSEGRGQGANDDEGIQPRLKVDDNQEVHKEHRED